MASYRGQTIDLKPTNAMAEEAERALAWRKEFGRGGTQVGVARANQLKRRDELSPSVVRRMFSFFSRHEVDKQAEGFSPGEDGYPSAGRVAWGLWGGDAAFSWSRGKVATLNRIDEERKSKGYYKDKDKKRKTLYVHRKVVNAEEIVRWAKSQGFETTLPAEDMHVTVAFSRAEMDWDDVPKSYEMIIIAASANRKVKELGENGEAKVLGFESRALQKRFDQLREKGASWDHESYQPHVTISYGKYDNKKLKAYDGHIVLGPEVFEELNENWKAGVVEKKESLRVGDYVSWNSSGGSARGRIERIVRDGEINVPDSSFTITGTPDDPAALIVLWREGSDGWEATDRKVGHKLSTLTKISALKSEAQKSAGAAVQTVQQVSIKRIDDDKRVVYGEVYAPYVLDTHGEFMSPEDIELMAHRFMKLDLGAVIDTNHDNVANGSYPIESFIAREGDPDYTAGAWVLGVKVPDDDIWLMVKSGDLNGFSFQTMVRSKEVEADYAVVRDHVGETEPHGDHTHVYFVEMDDMGRVIRGRTNEVLGHSHEIVRASVTATAAGHSHRFFL